MLRPALVALLFSTAACCQSVGIFLEFDSTPSRAAVEAMKHEVDQLLRPSGVSLKWRLAADNRGSESFANLVLLKFQGKCRADSWTAGLAPRSTRTLGTSK